MVVIGCSLNTNTNKDCDTSRRLGSFDDGDDVGALTFWVQILQSCVIQMNCYHFVHPVRSFKMHEMRLSKATNVQARKHFLTGNEDYKYYITKTVTLILNCMSMILTFFLSILMLNPVSSERVEFYQTEQHLVGKRCF